MYKWEAGYDRIGIAEVCFIKCDACGSTTHCFCVDSSENEYGYGCFCLPCIQKEFTTERNMDKQEFFKNLRKDLIIVGNHIDHVFPNGTETQEAWTRLKEFLIAVKSESNIDKTIQDVTDSIVQQTKSNRTLTESLMKEDKNDSKTF